MKIKDILQPKILDLFTINKETIGDIEIVELHKMPLNLIIEALGFRINSTMIEYTKLYDLNSMYVFIPEVSPLVSKEKQTYIKAKIIGLILFDPKYQRKIKEANMIELNHNNQDDIKRILTACINNGFYITPEQAEEAWLLESESYAASWLNLTDLTDLEISKIIKAQLS